MKSLIASALLLGTIGGKCAADAPGTAGRWEPVAGTGVHYFTSAIVHEAHTQPTETGFVQRSTDIIDLAGDLVGRVLYHPVSRFDFAEGTLINTGHQVFSGTVLGSEPVMLFDDDYRFEVNLATGETVGEVFLVRTLAGPPVRCILDIVSTGPTAAGDAAVAYTGRCRIGAVGRTGESVR
jgi:hypothetical protein